MVVRRLGELDPSDADLVGEQLAHQLLLTAAGGIHESIELGGLISWKPDEQRNSIFRHKATIADRYQAISQSRERPPPAAHTVADHGSVTVVFPTGIGAL